MSPPRSAARRLENKANNSSASAVAEVEELAADLRKGAQDRRSRRHQFRAALWRLSNLPRVMHCGRFTTSTAQGVAVRLSDGVAGLAGLQTCGSVWADPVCSAKILARRAVEIGAVLAMAQAQGYRLGFVTLTMRHERRQALKLLWNAAGAAWGRATSGRGWQEAQARHGVVGWVRVWEVTYGRNGWHVHVHAVVVLDPAATSATLDQVASGMYDRWARGLRAAGLASPLRRGQDWHLALGEDAGASIAEYLAKLNGLPEGAVPMPAPAEALGVELTHVRPGRSRGGLGTSPVWSLLAEVVDDGDATALRRWHEWETASKGRRQVGWSKGLRARFALPEVDRTDDELAAEEVGTDDDTLVVISLDGWHSLVATPHRIPMVLDAAENGGLVGLRALLDGWGDVAYWTVA